MYRIFVGQTPIILSTKRDLGEAYLSLPIKETNIKQIIKRIKKEGLQNVNLYHPKEHKLLKHFKKQIKPITAAGGLVYNSKNEILFILRKGYWDLPKGKVKKEEDLERAAMREVEEETGVSQLKITKALTPTFHTLKRKGKYRLKITHWFEMYTDYDRELVPQTDEDITRVEWMNFKKSQKALQNSYENIKLLFPHEYLADQNH